MSAPEGTEKTGEAVRSTELLERIAAAMEHEHVNGRGEDPGMCWSRLPKSAFRRMARAALREIGNHAL